MNKKVYISIAFALAATLIFTGILILLAGAAPVTVERPAQEAVPLTEMPIGVQALVALSLLVIALLVAAPWVDKERASCHQEPAASLQPEHTPFSRQNRPVSNTR
jgi:membrane protein implicated in regulation of membrane protease activity